MYRGKRCRFESPNVSTAKVVRQRELDTTHGSKEL